MLARAQRSRALARLSIRPMCAHRPRCERIYYSGALGAASFSPFSPLPISLLLSSSSPSPFSHFHSVSLSLSRSLSLSLSLSLRVGRVAGGRRPAPAIRDPGRNQRPTTRDPERSGPSGPARTCPVRPGHTRPGSDICQDRDFKIIFLLQYN